MDGFKTTLSKQLNPALVLLLLLPPLASAAVQGAASGPPVYASDRVLVKFKPGRAATSLSELSSQIQASVLDRVESLDVHVLQVPAGTVAEQLARLQRNPNVVYAEPDYYRVLDIPTEGQDPEGSGYQYFNQQWALNNTGQLHTMPDPLLGEILVSGAVDADIDAPEGWDLTHGSAGVKIAILDTGVDCRTAARPGGSLEFIGGSKCLEEVSFVDAYVPTVDDVVGHRSHVAGIAAAETDNAIGIAGVGRDSSIGSLKACFEYYIDLYPPLEIWTVVGICPVSASAAAITYAADHGYHVINTSYASDQVDENGDPLGLGGITQTELDAVNYAWDRGAVLVAAAGNNNDTFESYPAAYDKVIAVGATDRYDDRASFSTFSSSWVSLLAPGENIISTVPNDLCVLYADLLGLNFDPDSDACLDWYSGTSMASPHVAGAAALVWAKLFPADLADPDTCLSAEGFACNLVVRQHLEIGADALGALGQNMLAWSQHGRLNLAGALGEWVVPPPAPELLSLTDNGDGTVTIDWDFNGDVEVQRETFNANIGTWQGLTTVWVGSGTSYTDASGSGTFRYRVGAVQGAGEPVWSAWSELEVTAEHPDEVGVWRPGTRRFYLDSNGNSVLDVGVEETLPFGVSTDTPVIGDWNGDGIDDVGVRRNHLFFLDSNANNVWDAGADEVFPFGLSGDTPLAGNW